MSGEEIISYGPICLVVTDLKKSVEFWERVIGLRVRESGEGRVELGTEKQTLVILEGGAKTGFRNGFSGLYHVALHVPSAAEFALILARLIELRWPISPTDHIMSKAIYLLDPDGITIEITLETPERFERYDMAGGRFAVIDAQGKVRGGTEPLDVPLALESLGEVALDELLNEETKIGHVHLYVPDLKEAYDFYRLVGFEDNLLAVGLGFADLSAGGVFKHRMAMNTWQSLGAPQAPEGSAGMKYFTMLVGSEDELGKVRERLPEVEEQEDGVMARDSAGNRFVLKV